MRIGCLCVTERRAHLFGIAVAAYADQEHEDRCLVVVCPTGEVAEYESVLARLGINPEIVPTELRGANTALRRLDLGCKHLVDAGCNAIATWDDDDWKHPTYLGEVSRRFEQNLAWLVTGYKWGLYVNARHLWAEDLSEHVKEPWGFWGASLAYRSVVWYSGYRFDRPGVGFQGYDPRLCQDVGKLHWAPPIDDDPYKMLSFCHDLNCYQHCRGGGFDLAPWISDNLSVRARTEIYRVRQYFIDHNIEPPQVQGPY